MNLTKIAILSDTHGFLCDKFLNELKSCDYVIHAGDIGSEQCYNKLKDLGKHLYMIKGNCDMGSYADFLPESLFFRISDV